MAPEALARPAIALALLLVPLAAASPLAAETHIVARADSAYVGEAFLADTTGTLIFTNLDLRAHDVVAVDVRAATDPWCARFPAGACPLFASPLIGLGEQAEVEGISQLTPLASYEFYCTTHTWMTGTLTAI